MNIEPSPAVRKDGDGTQTRGTQTALQWTALVCSPSPIPYDGAGTPQSSQQVALQAARMVTVLEAAEVTLCAHSWVVFKGLTRWLPTWAANEWMVAQPLLRDQELWQDMRAAVQLKTVTVYQVPAHAGLNTPPGNQEADSLPRLHQALRTISDSL